MAASAVTPPPAAPAADYPGSTLPSGWSRVFSKTRRRWLYRNKLTGESSWVAPMSAPAADTPALPTSDAATRYPTCRKCGGSNFPLLELPPDHPRKPYQTRVGRVKDKGEHWGQRKLLISEVQFLSLFSNGDCATSGTSTVPTTMPPSSTHGAVGGTGADTGACAGACAGAGASAGAGAPVRTSSGDGSRRLAEVEKPVVDELPHDSAPSLQPPLVVYAGAAPGYHIAFLSRVLFPSLHFVLVDPRSFGVEASDRIELRQELFTDAMADEFGVLARAGRRVLFMSDIRTEPNDEEHVAADMAMQLRWHNRMRPAATMFKFRLPWSPGTSRYPAGRVFLQPYAVSRSTETRLVTAGDAPLVDWDHTAYEERCFHFNTTARLHRYPHGVCGAGLSRSWDCAAEVAILQMYCARHRRAEWECANEEARAVIVGKLVASITQQVRGEPAQVWRARQQQEVACRRTQQCAAAGSARGIGASGDADTSVVDTRGGDDALGPKDADAAAAARTSSSSPGAGGASGGAGSGAGDTAGGSGGGGSGCAADDGHTGGDASAGESLPGPWLSPGQQRGWTCPACDPRPAELQAPRAAPGGGRGSRGRRGKRGGRAKSRKRRRRGGNNGTRSAAPRVSPGQAKRQKQVHVG